MSFALLGEGHEAKAVEDGAGAIRELTAFQPELIVLDFNLPDATGADLCAEIRLASRVPVLFLTARAGETDKARGFRAGADDYLVKPFSPRELCLRVGALLRRSAWNATPATVLTVGDFELDATARVVRRGGQLLSISPMEFDILHALASTPGSPWPPERLARRLGLEVSSPLEAAELIRVKISRLRRKIEPDPARPAYLFSHRGSGYLLVAGGETAPETPDERDDAPVGIAG